MGKNWPNLHFSLFRKKGFKALIYDLMEQTDAAGVAGA